MHTTTEYFTVGHDVVSSLFEPDVCAKYVGEPGKKFMSFFLAGLGDDRRLLQTLNVITESEKKSIVPKRTYHFTVNDIQKSALARDLIIWMLLDELSKLKSMPEQAALEILNTVFFIFLSTVMPSYAFAQLHKTSSPTSWTIKSRSLHAHLAERQRPSKM